MRFSCIQTLRMLAILSVVLAHLALVEVKFGQGATVLPVFLVRGVGGIDLFFIISGLMMVATNRGKFHSGKRALYFIYNRLVRIYPLYWIYSFVALAAFFVHPAWWVTNAPETRRDLLVSFLLLPSRRLPLLNVAWMLTHLIYFYFIFALFLWLLKEERLPAGLTLWALLVLAGQVYFRFGSSPSPTIDVMLHPYTLEFIAGCFLGMFTLRNRHSRGLIFLAVGIIVYGGSLFLLSLFPPQGMVTGWNRVLHFAVPHALILYGAITLERQGRLSLPPGFNRLGDASYSIYLSHVLVLSAAGSLWTLFPTPASFHHVLILMVMVGGVIFFGWLSFRYLESPLLKRFRDWGRNNLQFLTSVE
ncbi:MAG: acyltransferase family protein [Syntrophales bacterium]